MMPTKCYESGYHEICILHEIIHSRVTYPNRCGHQVPKAGLHHTFKIRKYTSNPDNKYGRNRKGKKFGSEIMKVYRLSRQVRLSKGADNSVIIEHI